MWDDDGRRRKWWQISDVRRTDIKGGLQRRRENKRPICDTGEGKDSNVEREVRQEIGEGRKEEFETL